MGCGESRPAQVGDAPNTPLRQLQHKHGASVQRLHDLVDRSSTATAQHYRRRLAKFILMCEQGRIAWIKVSYLRSRRGSPVLARRQDLERHALTVGAPPAGAQVWVVSHPWLAKQHADPTGEQVLQLIEKLDTLQAADADVVFFDYWSMPQRDVRGVDDRSPAEAKAFEDTMRVLNALYSSEFARVVVIAEIRESAALYGPSVVDAHGAMVAVDPNTTEYANRGWCFFELLTCLTFQTVSSIDEFIEAQMTLMFEGMFQRASFTNAKSDRAAVTDLLVKRAKQLLERGVNGEDAEFDLLAEMVTDGTYKLLRAGYIRELAKSAGILSFRQGLPPEAFATPAQVASLRAQDLFAISHPWISARHPDPEGIKVQDLAAKFDRLRVGDEALVMFDFASIPQRDPNLFDPTKVSGGDAYLESRTPEENAVLRYALGHMSLWYSHPQVQVLVTHMGVPDDDPRGYFDRGWCLFEITCAIFAGTVVFDEVELIEFFLERFFLPQLRTKQFTNGKADEELVCRKFRELIYQRAGM